MKRQNKNFLYNLAYQLLTFIIPIVLTPYVSRVLGVSNIGIYSFSYSIVYYFMLLTMLGINNYGSREIARCKDIKERGRVFCGIYGLQLTSGIISFIAYGVLILLLNYDHKELMLINYLFLLSAVLDINWFFFGLEKFKLTTTRSAIIKICSVIFVFLCVKNKDDLWLYTLILGLSTLISQLYMWLFVRKEAVLVKYNIREVMRHLKPCLVFFIPVISYSIYRVMDKTMIGAMSSTVELGYYESAEKIINIPVSLVAALGTVMLPHMSKKHKSEIKESIYDTFELTSFMTIAAAMALLIISHDFSLLFFGDGFLKTGSIIAALSCTIVFSGIANVIRTNYLIPLKKDKVYVVSTIVGALVNLVLNLIFIPLFGAYGACIGTIAAEFVLMIYQVIKTRRDISYRKVVSIAARYLLRSILMASVMIVIALLSRGWELSLRLILQIACGCGIYMTLNYKYIVKDFLGRTAKVK